MDNRLLTEDKLDADNDYSLRPTTLDEYVGQEKIKENLRVYIQACKSRGEALDHVLLYGPPGLGKTTLAHILANELNVDFKITSGPGIERAANLASLLTNLDEKDVLFLDEIHRLNKSIEEVLYPAMEDFALDISTGKGAGATSIRLNLKHFTLIGATTRAGMLTGPLRDRFGIICRMEMYTDDELCRIVKRSAGILKIHIDDDAAVELSKRSRGTPRIANRLLKRVRDFADVYSEGVIKLEVTKRALDSMEIDSIGLDTNDRRMIEAIIKKFNGGPVGLDTLATALNEDGVTLEDVVEPYLIRQGFIARTPRGRIAMPRAYEHLGIEMKNEQLSFLNDKGSIKNE